MAVTPTGLVGNRIQQFEQLSQAQKNDSPKGQPKTTDTSGSKVSELQNKLAGKLTQSAILGKTDFQHIKAEKAMADASTQTDDIAQQPETQLKSKSIKLGFKDSAVLFLMKTGIIKPETAISHIKPENKDSVATSLFEKGKLSASDTLSHLKPENKEGFALSSFEKGKLSASETLSHLKPENKEGFALSSFEKGKLRASETLPHLSSEKQKAFEATKTENFAAFAQVLKTAGLQKVDGLFRVPGNQAVSIEMRESLYKSDFAAGDSSELTDFELYAMADVFKAELRNIQPFSGDDIKTMDSLIKSEKYQNGDGSELISFAKTKLSSFSEEQSSRLNTIFGTAGELFDVADEGNTSQFSKNTIAQLIGHSMMLTDEKMDLSLIGTSQSVAHQLLANAEALVK